ncbi:UDP-N-acetyl-D-mannosaminouronate:lipid I N-acetyl-D-mannosaminouronosyltransferase [Christiangramia gaetbulicola]|uniref:UDP-N-acetyl-D-mannosaminouronate:lipid I N-acetyl-D-mannosaminouronosyltransferase n=1 Tax=Christiangramia gaetbulicola TaxID=703340 RepID=A0A2T6AL51_9FLAO|nr:WecB/TagA/CpsF family glycosyltransferase [Christiangramia gaetbulicola]PTX44476.1 UDP-N-acetyl-D-mannosaminouronate:lipid I N-acetyl-D-mannosaminouronosyltransferase [Christiangramia gaetbulicola]
MQSQILNGVQTFAPESRDSLIEFAAKGKKILVAVNAEKILHATDTSRDIINRNLGYPDGIGAVMALKQKGVKDVVKIPGCELWLDIIKTFHKEKTFYLVGGKQEIIQETVSELKRQFAGIKIVNFRNGYIKSEEERQELIKDILLKKPDVVFVAMGSPKQELLMEEMQKLHPALYQGLGGSFDVFTGNVERAPDWWVKNNLEWAYRLVKQPSRIKRQIHLVRFLYLLKMNKF